jgi:DNA topoisomerase VI subunit B
MTGYRNSGYTPQSAVADLIDNSISAGAKRVSVLVSQKVDGLWKVYIADDGCGMNEDILIRAMEYGSSRDLSKSELNVYGLGMKVASSSFSKRFSVVSKGTNGKTLAATWDLDEMVEHPWEFELVDANSVQDGRNWNCNHLGKC